MFRNVIEHLVIFMDKKKSRRSNRSKSRSIFLFNSVRSFRIRRGWAYVHILLQNSRRRAELNSFNDQIFQFFTAIFSLIGNVTLFVGILKASTVLYNKLLTSVLKWPMRIFDSTPVGRITNRFTIDIYSLDYEVGPKTVSILALTKRVKF